MFITVVCVIFIIVIFFRIYFCSSSLLVKPSVTCNTFCVRITVKQTGRTRSSLSDLPVSVIRAPEIFLFTVCQSETFSFQFVL